MKNAGVWLLAMLCMAMTSACATGRAWHSGRAGIFDRLEKKSGRSVASSPKQDPSDEEPGQEINLPKLRRAAAGLRWPLAQVKITSPFGKRKGEYHEGVDLKAHSGTTVYAADGGSVIYSGSRIRGYGKLIVVKHASGLSTVYAHNSRLLVRAGQRVVRGQRIAISGSTGRATGPHLHFEVRSGVAALDPQQVMPGTTVVAATDDSSDRLITRTHNIVPVRRVAARR